MSAFEKPGDLSAALLKVLLFHILSQSDEKAPRVLRTSGDKDAGSPQAVA